MLREQPPVISLALPSQGLKVVRNTDYTFTPDIQHSDVEGGLEMNMEDFPAIRAASWERTVSYTHLFQKWRGV